MTNFLKSVLRCPVCGNKMTRKENSLHCEGPRTHCFDLASAGYVNLASAKAAGGGDDASLIRARTAFLEAGHYAPVARAVCELLHTHCPEEPLVLDAGCGEGYYASQMARAGAQVFGLDLSKRGILHAAKVAKREGISAFFAVAGIFELPVADHCLDAVVSLFAPVCESEFRRVLKPGGVLILAGAGPGHLYSLKEVLYDTPYCNEARADAPQEMSFVDTTRVSYKAQLDGAALQDLFEMTPYFYRTSREGRARLAATTTLGVDVDVEIAVYRN